MGAGSSALILTDGSVFYLVARLLFLLISSLTVIWVYILSFKITRSFIAALIAGLIFSASFEFNYHSRWAVSDTVAVQFVFLSTMILFLGLSFRKKIILSSIIAGLALGTKYTAGIAILNIYTYIISFKGINFSKKTDIIIYSTFIFIVTFIFLTPGTVLEPLKFYGDLETTSYHYSSWHFGYTVPAGTIHCAKIIKYIIFCIFSKNYIISIFISLFFFIGVVYSLKTKNINVISLSLVMALYLFYVSRYRVMLVRNILYIFPYFCVVSSLGAFFIFKKIKSKIIIKYLNIIIILILSYSTALVTNAALTIYHKEKLDVKGDLQNFLEVRHKDRFFFSRGVCDLMSFQQNTVPMKSSYLVFFKNEARWPFLQANKYRLYKKVLGVQDINFDYYPTWLGQDRIVIMRYSDANDHLLEDLGIKACRK